MRSLVCAVLMAVALGGCAGKEPAAEEPQEVVEPLLAVFDVRINGTAVESVNETLQVVAATNVTFDANASTGDLGIFLWDFGDGTQDAGESVVHAFSDAGLFNVTLTIGAGNATANTTRLLRVVEGVPPVPELLSTAPFMFEGNVPMSNPNSPTEAGVDYVDHVVTVAGESNGTAAVAQEMRIVLDVTSSTTHTSILYLRAPDGTTLAQEGALPGTADQELVYDSAMPPGDYVVRVRQAIGVEMDYTLTGVIDYYSQ